jgi:hypothetical protein
VYQFNRSGPCGRGAIKGTILIRKLSTAAVAAAIAGVCLAAAQPTCAAPTIVSYTQPQNVSGAGSGWSYNYNGSTGTLNDGIVPNSLDNDLLVDNSLNPSFTFTLNGTYKLSEIDILSNYLANLIPGDLTSAVITSGGVSETVSSTNYGPTTVSGWGANERLVLPSDLASIATNTFTLSDPVSQGPWSQFSSYGEVVALGAPFGGVPEPSTWAMLIAGVAMIGFAARRRTAGLALAA